MQDALVVWGVGERMSPAGCVALVSRLTAPYLLSIAAGSFLFIILLVEHGARWVYLLLLMVFDNNPLQDHFTKANY